MRAFLQQRLRLLTGIVSLVLGSLFIAFFLQNSLNSQDNPVVVLVRLGTRFPNSVLFGLVCVSSLLHLLLRRRRLSERALTIADGLFLQVLFAPCLLLYGLLHFASFSGFSVVVDFLLLFILNRAVLVPSTAARTLWISLPAPVGELLIQLAHGESHAFPGQAYRHSHFVDLVVQHQVLLIAAIAVAATASKVNLGLRRRTYEAQRLGQYELIRRIGMGAMGEVYLGTHTLLKRPTAVKLLRPELAGQRTLERSAHEVRQTSRLTHPNTVCIYDYGHTADGLFYYAMEYLRGADPRRIVERTGPMRPARVIHVLSQACGALAEAHGKGLIHRDIKPANIMLCEQGGEVDVVKLVDFGLAQEFGKGGRTRAGEISGTPETIAPEVLTGGVVGPATDLYSLCAVGCYLLTGRPLFEAESVSELLSHHRFTEPLPPSRHNPEAPEDLEALLLKGLRKDPERRLASAADLRRELLGCRDAGGWSLQEAARWWQSFEQEAEPLDSSELFPPPESSTGQETLAPEPSDPRQTLPRWAWEAAGRTENGRRAGPTASGMTLSPATFPRRPPPDAAETIDRPE
jgi:serine/threonine-protein kinase